MCKFKGCQDQPRPIMEELGTSQKGDTQKPIWTCICTCTEIYTVHIWIFVCRTCVHLCEICTKMCPTYIYVYVDVHIYVCVSVDGCGYVYSILWCFSVCICTSASSKGDQLTILKDPDRSYTRFQTNMTLENSRLSKGNTSSNGRCSTVMLVFGFNV